MFLFWHTKQSINLVWQSIQSKGMIVATTKTANKILRFELTKQRGQT
jgi:hypothetical protein